MFTKKFWMDLGERAIMTAAEAAVAAIGVNQVSALDMDWGHIGGIALTAAALSALKSLYARNHGDSEDASLVK